MNRIIIDAKGKEKLELLHKNMVRASLVHGNIRNKAKIKKKYDEICDELDKELRNIGLSITFKKLITADFTTISQCMQTLRDNGVNFGSYAKKNISGKPFKKIYESYDKIINNGYNKRLINNLGMSVCPYCNRDFINNRGEQPSVQLDHFYPRSLFPIFAVCLYNLIPACYACNHIKSDKIIGLSPYEDYSLDDLLTFTYSLEDIDFLHDSNSINLEILFAEEDGKSLKKNFSELHLNEAYSLHKQEVQSILRKVMIFSDKKIDELWYSYNDLFDSREEIVQDIFGSYSSGGYQNRILAKLKSDIYKESKKNIIY